MGIPMAPTGMGTGTTTTDPRGVSAGRYCPPQNRIGPVSMWTKPLAT